MFHSGLPITLSQQFQKNYKRPLKAAISLTTVTTWKNALRQRTRIFLQLTKLHIMEYGQYGVWLYGVESGLSPHKNYTDTTGFIREKPSVALHTKCTCRHLKSVDDVTFRIRGNYYITQKFATFTKSPNDLQY